MMSQSQQTADDGDTTRSESQNVEVIDAPVIGEIANPISLVSLPDVGEYAQYDSGNLSLDIDSIKPEMTHKRKNWVIAFLVLGYLDIATALIIVLLAYGVKRYRN